MVQGHELGLLLVALISEAMGTLSGFGSSTFFVPFAQFFEDLRLVMALTALLHVFGNLSKIYLFRKHFVPALFKSFALPAIIMTGAGAYLTSYASTHLMKEALGIFLILMSILFYFRPKFIKNPNRRAVAVLSGVSGFLTGFLGTGGALRGLALSALGTSKNVFVMTSASVDLGGDVLRAGIYISKGYMGSDHFFYLPLLFICAWIGSLIGQKLLDKISEDVFQKIVLGVIFLTGILTLR